MRILVYFQTNRLFHHGTTGLGYINELRRAGYDLMFVNPLAEVGVNQPGHLWDEFITAKVKKENSNNKIDLFFSSVRDDEMSESAVARIRDLGIITVNATWDNISVPHRVRKIASAFDLFWVHEPEAIATIKAYGAHVFHAPVAANPYLYHPHLSSENESIDVGFCGACRESRPMYVKALFNRHIPVTIYGEGWGAYEKEVSKKIVPFGASLYKVARHALGSARHKNGRKLLVSAAKRRLRRCEVDYRIGSAISAHAHPPLSFEEMVRLYSRSKLSLGFNELGNTYLLKKPLLQVRLRDFEAPMSGACHIAFRVPTLQSAFEEGKEMLFYSSVEELADKVRYYLSPRRDNERLKIKERARRRAECDHTWSERFSILFSELQLK